MQLIVSDTGPLVALSRARRLSLLEALFETVIIPRVVLDELKIDEYRPGIEDLSLATARNSWLKAEDQGELTPFGGLGAGECAAIVLAERHQCPLLVDERKGRAVARKRGVDIIGTGRVLLEAKDHQLIPSVSTVLRELRKQGYRLSDRLCQRLAEHANEDFTSPPD